MKLSSVIFYLGLVSALLTPARALDLRFINWDGEDGGLKYTNKGKTVTIHAAESSFSPVYKFEGAGPLVLFKEVMIEGKIVRQTAATLAVPAGLTHAIVVVAATDAELTTYAGMWIDDSPVTRPAGTIRLVNFSSHSVAFKIDTSEFTIAPTSTEQVPVKTNVRRILMQAATQVEGKWKVVANNPLPVRSGLRLLLLMRDGRPMEGSEPNVVDLLSFYDQPPAIPENGVAGVTR
ncbi:hypothetical protein [Rariglobus hedericola]|uniref:DUF4397 domain-containing protein n=1 Tax=Rariglobus hedericola TaxID=2597822 RepID=A0A556QSS2_9BACT|nr:hypothetical protein [Rariglobus hedericola]TSJ79663.1 hypothetical protein FPL22_10360 [Rariglobus hedericola]